MNEADEQKWARRIHFPEWAERLAAEPWGEAEKKSRKITIAWFLKYCKETGRVVSVAEAKRFVEGQVEEKRPPGKIAELWRQALRWFCTRGQRGAAADRGTNDGDGTLETGPRRAEPAHSAANTERPSAGRREARRTFPTPSRDGLGHATGPNAGSVRGGSTSRGETPTVIRAGVAWEEGLLRGMRVGHY